MRPRIKASCICSSDGTDKTYRDSKATHRAVVEMAHKNFKELDIPVSTKEKTLEEKAETAKKVFMAMSKTRLKYYIINPFNGNQVECTLNEYTKAKELGFKVSIS